MLLSYVTLGSILIYGTLSRPKIDQNRKNCGNGRAQKWLHPRRRRPIHRSTPFATTMADKKMKDNDKTKNLLKPGQKFPTPTPGFGDRVFYETLLRQRPHSTMAQEWYVTKNISSRKMTARGK
jgi:hypothetical protein